VSRFLATHQHNNAIQRHSVISHWFTLENTDEKWQHRNYTTEKLTTQKSKTKLLWFCLFLQNSARKQRGLILQCSWTHMGQIGW